MGAPTKSSPNRSAGSASILYVEDDPLVSMATMDMLETGGHKIHAAADAKEALTLLDRHPEIQLMVTDVGLPGMDGHALGAEARRRRPGIKILFLSGYDQARLTGGAAPDPAIQYLSKPYEEAQLVAALEAMLR